MKIKMGNFEREVSGITVTKKILGEVVAYGVGITIYSIVKDHLPADLKFHKKIAVALGCWALKGVIVDAAEAYANGFVDKCVNSIDEIKKAISEAQEEISDENKDSNTTEAV